MKQPFDSQIESDESAKIHHARDAALDQLSHLILIVDHRPGIGLELLEAQRNPPPLPVHAENVDIQLVANAEHLTGMLHPPPAQL